MWEDNTAKTVIRNILLALLSVALIFWLGKSITAALEENKIEDQQLSEAHQQQQQQQIQERKEAEDKINQEYQADLAVLEEYMPGIICWGDILTTGSSGNVSYPSTLQECIKKNITDQYNLGYSLEDISGITRIDWDEYKVSIPVLNMGAGDENTCTILGRSGVVPFVTSKDFTIPAGTEKVQIEIQSENGEDVTPLTGGSAGVNNVTINGIEGVLSIETDAEKFYSYSYYYFNRLEPGKETDIPAGTKIITDAADKYKNYIHVVWMGTYEGFHSTNELIEQIKSLLARQTQNPERYIVIGLCSTGNRWYYNSNYFDIMDSAMMQAFGDRYINLRKYLCTDGVFDAEIVLTNEDRNKTLAGVIPGTFMSNSGNSELTATAYQLLGKLVYDRMDKLGYFDEIKTELKIKPAAAQ